jgi:hypothetical protein
MKFAQLPVEGLHHLEIEEQFKSKTYLVPSHFILQLSAQYVLFFCAWVQGNIGLQVACVLLTTVHFSADPHDFSYTHRKEVPNFLQRNI